MSGSRDITFCWIPAMLAVMMFCVFSAVSFADRFIPVFCRSLSTYRINCMFVLVYLGKEPVPSSQYYFTLHPFLLRLWDHSQYVLRWLAFYS